LRDGGLLCVSLRIASLSESLLSCRLFFLNCCWCCGPFPLLLISLQTRFVSFFFCAPFIIVFQHLWTRRVRYPEGFFSLLLLLLHDAAGFYFFIFLRRLFERSDLWVGHHFFSFFLIF
jgi:hypothetical protein